MKLSPGRILTIARREYLATVRRRGFVFTIVGTPLLYALLFFIVAKPQVTERAEALRRFRTLAVVDSSGVFANAPREAIVDLQLNSPLDVTDAPPARESFRTQVRFYPTFAEAEKDLRAEAVQQVLVVPPDYLETGALRRYAGQSSVFSMDDRVVSRWLVRGLLAGETDSQRVERVGRPLGQSRLFTPGRDNGWHLKDDRREAMEFLFPLAFGLLLGLSIAIGGQYLLQGVNEEKESRILESMLCNVSPEELLGGKLVGLGGAGLTVAFSWVLMGALLGGPASGFLQSAVRPSMLVALFAYMMFGYLFYGSLMTGIGSVASNMREAQQFSVWFMFLTFIPFYLLPTLLGNPGSALAVGISLFPPTAPVAMMLRMAAPGSVVPAWQIAASLALLGLSAVLVLLASARVFRVGMLMYGKTPSLPEILRWIRTG